MIEFNLVPFQMVAKEIMALADAHADDANEEAEGYANADWMYYTQAGDLGLCWVATARDQGELVGYSVFFIEQNINHKHIREATNSAIFVDRAYRKTRLFDDLRRHSEESLAKLGVNVVQYVLKGEKLGRLLSMKGYRDDFKIWSKEL